MKNETNTNFYPLVQVYRWEGHGTIHQPCFLAVKEGDLNQRKKNPRFAQFFFGNSQSRSTWAVILANHPKF